MAKSIQSANGKSIRVPDMDLLVIVCAFIRRESTRERAEVGPLSPVVESWTVALRNSGPGTVDLEMQKWADDEVVRDALAARLLEVEAEVRAQGDSLSLTYLRSLDRVPGVDWGEAYPSKYLLHAAQQLRTLLGK
jgi:hypothetical protein